MKPGETEFYITIRGKNADSMVKARYHVGLFAGEPLSSTLNGLAGKQVKSNISDVRERHQVVSPVKTQKVPQPPCVGGKLGEGPTGCELARHRRPFDYRHRTRIASQGIRTKKWKQSVMDK
jgi:hypothetical protein